MATPDQIIVLLGQALLDLLQILDGRSHGIFRGTCEAVLAEAQGGQIGPGGFNHLQSLRNTLTAVTARQDAVENALNQVGGIDPGLAQRIRQILSPLLNDSAEVIETLEETEQMAADLARTSPTRLQGVLFGQGGMGPEIARDARSLVTTQIQQTAGQLIGRGIEPRLIPSIQAGGAQLMDKIRQLPTTVNDALQNLIAIITAIRIAVQQAAVQAGRAGLAVLADALAAIGEALAAFGSRLVFVPIFVNFERTVEKFLHPRPDFT
jgi:hypothetical protein